MDDYSILFPKNHQNMAISKVLAHPHLVETLFWLYILVLRETQKLFFVHSTEMDIESITKTWFFGMAKIHLFTNAERKLFQWLKGIFVDRVTLDFLYKFTLMKKNKCILLSIAHIMVVLRFTLQNDVFSCIDIASGYILDYFLLGKILQNNNPNRYENNKNKKKKKW